MRSPTRRIFDGAEITRGLSWRQFIAIVCGFWFYVTASNVLYTYGLRIGITKFTTVLLFAPWNVRVLQHVLLLPALLASFWASLVLDWRPLWRGIVFQGLLGAAFAATAYPAIGLAEIVLGDTGHDPSHGMGTWLFWQDPAMPSLW